MFLFYILLKGDHRKTMDIENDLNRDEYAHAQRDVCVNTA